MDPEDVLKVVLREMRAIGSGWRADWSGFDGRTLRNQLDDLARWAERPTQDYTQGTEFAKQQWGED